MSTHYENRRAPARRTRRLLVFRLNQPAYSLFGVHVQREPFVTVPVMLRLAVRDALTTVGGWLGLVVSVGHGAQATPRCEAS